MLVILFIIAAKFFIFTGGTEVLLLIEPVDPRSPLRGDYITFRYQDISRILSNRVFEPIGKGDTVYIVLERRFGPYWEGTRMQKNMPQGEEVFLRGTVANVESDTRSSYSNYQTYTIVYGLEDYFIPEGKGSDSRLFRSQTAARVAVDDKGNGVLKGLIVGGVRWP